MQPRNRKMRVGSDFLQLVCVFAISAPFTSTESGLSLVELAKYEWHDPAGESRRFTPLTCNLFRLRGGRDRDEDEVLDDRTDEDGSSALEKEFLFSSVASDDAMLSSMPSEAFKSFSNETDDGVLQEANDRSWGEPFASKAVTDGATPSVLSKGFANETFADDGADFSDVQAATRKEWKGKRDELGIEVEPLGELDVELLEAIKEGDTDKIRELILQGGDPNVHDHDIAELYGVHYAAMKGHEDAVDCLIALGAKLDMPSGTGDGVMQYATEEGRTAMIRKLVRMGVGVDTPGFADTTALFSAVEKGQLDAMKLLVELGADVNRTDMWSTSVLHFAAMHGRPDMVRLLAEHGADLEADDWAGRTPLQVAAEHGEDACCEVLLDAGADTEVRAENGFNALRWADWRGRRSTMRLLKNAMGIVDHDDDVDDVDVDMAEGALVKKSDTLVEGSREWMMERVKEIGAEKGQVGGQEVIVQTGKRKGLRVLTDIAGRIVKPNTDMGPAIGRPSNAGVCHLKNKQCRAQDCTKTAYYGHPNDGIRRFCREHRRECDMDLKEKAMPTPKWGGALPMPWNV